MTRDELRVLVDGLAAGIPGGWTVSDDEYHPTALDFHLTDRDGVAFSVTYSDEGRHPRKLHVSGDYGHTLSRHFSSSQDGAMPSINIDPKRGLAAVAGDIYNRFLPAHRALVGTLREHEAKQVLHATLVRANADRILAASGGTLRETANDQGDSYRIGVYDSDLGGGFAFSWDVSGSQVNFRHGWMPIELAVKFAALLAEEYGHVDQA